MSIEHLRDALLYCTIINFGILALWALLFLLPHAWMYRWMNRVFRLGAEQVDAISFAGILFYKVGILFLNLVPYLALRIIG